MPLRGLIRSWIFEDITDFGGGVAPAPEDVAFDLSDDVKLWALLTNGQISVSSQAAVGIQVSFEI